MWIKDHFGHLINLSRANSVYHWFYEKSADMDAGYVVIVRFGKSRVRVTRSLREAEAEAIVKRIADIIGSVTPL